MCFSRLTSRAQRKLAPDLIKMCLLYQAGGIDNGSDGKLVYPMCIFYTLLTPTCLAAKQHCEGVSDSRKQVIVCCLEM